MSEQTSDILLERLMSLHPKIIDLTLDRMTRLLAELGDPQNNLPPVIHVAGTNGKGSTLAMIRAGLEAAGQSCHVYTSPHLVRFHERIRLGGTLIDEEALQAVLEECETLNGDTPITYFEITTCAALLAFARASADYTLLEVGLGGRLDATNVVDCPAITVITPVDLDHQQYLGETLSEIAGEKAGILKRNVYGIVAQQHDEAMAAIERQAARVGATLKVQGQDWHVMEENGRLVYQDDMGLLDLPLPALQGAHQIQNAGTALATLRYLGAEADFDATVAKAEWPARMQKLSDGPAHNAAPKAEIWLDGGHNPAAGKALKQVIGSLPNRDLYLITGMLNTKDITNYLRPLGDLAKKLFAVSIPGETATLSAEDTAKAAKSAGIDADTARSVEDAAAQIHAINPNARILICGSLYLAGHVLHTHS
ncbi:MAG: folylpolyglutamate synthase/dihydrofolate synthase family protein [Pseudomonadota bacterium]